MDLHRQGAECRRRLQQAHTSSINESKRKSSQDCSKLTDRFKYKHQATSSTNLVNVNVDPIKCISKARNTPSSALRREADTKVKNREKKLNNENPTRE